MFGGAKSPRLFGLHGPKRQRGFVLVGARRAALGGTWSPRDWFRRSEPGFWYEAVDPANQGATITMYQDSTGVTPVTAPEQAVGLVLDRSRGLVRGAELATALTSNNASVVYAGGSATFTAAATSNGVQQAMLELGKTYEVTFRIVSISAGSIRPNVGNAGSGVAQTVAGTYTQRLVCSGNTTASIIAIAAPATAVVDSISFKELPGNHASQSVSASRPVISQRYNLLTNTAFSGAVAGTPGTFPTGWSSIVTTGTTAIPASGITLSALAGARQCIAQTVVMAANASYTYSLDVLAASGDGDLARIVAAVGTITGTSNIAVSEGTGTKSITVTAGAAGATVTVRLGAGAFTGVGVDTSVTIANPDLRLTIDTTKGMPAYQRVNTSTDYDTAGFLPYFRFDGFDDSWQTAAIDFTSTDKMTIVAGLTKLSDAAAGVLCELTASSSANAGSFALFAPDSAAARYLWRSKGTVAADVTGAATAPVTNVVAATGDIAGDSSTLRVNGVAATPTTTDQGTGNFVSAALNIGRRNNATVPFSGRLAVLIGRGAASNDSQIIKAERYCQRRTGASF